MLYEQIKWADVVVVSGCGPLGLGMVAGAKKKVRHILNFLFFCFLPFVFSSFHFFLLYFPFLLKFKSKQYVPTVSPHQDPKCIVALDLVDWKLDIAKKSGLHLTPDT